MLRLSEGKGFELKCRDPRCSLACLANWRRREAAILSRFLDKHLPADMTVYRGCLSLPPGSTVDDHRHVLSRFNRILRTAAKRHGHVCRVYLMADITASDSLHWDMVAYTDLSGRSVRTAVREAWERAGGMRYSLRSTDPSEWVATARYTAKDTPAASKREPTKYVHLPARNRLEQVRASDDFWDGMTKAGLWAECLKAWFGDPQPDPDPVSVSNNDNEPYDRFDDPKSDTLTRARAIVHAHTPRTSDKALTLPRLSRRLSIPPEWLARLLTSDPRVRTTSTGGYWLQLWGDDSEPKAEPVPTPQRGEGCERSEQEHGGVPGTETPPPPAA